MKKSIFFAAILFFVSISCVTINPPVKDAESSMNYGKTLFDEGKISLAIIEFKKSRDYYDEAGYTYSAFAVYPYIARAYYLENNVDAAIDTYFEALDYALKQGEGKIFLEDLAVQMWDLYGLLKEVGRIEEAVFILGDLEKIYRELDDLDKVYEIIRERESLK